MKTIKLRPLPWITDGANDFLGEKIRSEEIKNILEFGSGASTHWLLKQGVNLISVEHNPSFFKFLKNKINEEYIFEYILAPRPYNNLCAEFQSRALMFDLVIVDGRDRVKCVESAHPLVAPGGYLMLDNDERIKYRRTHDILLNWEKQSYKQVGADYTGWKNPCPWVTTVWQKPE